VYSVSVSIQNSQNMNYTITFQDSIIRKLPILYNQNSESKQHTNKMYIYYIFIWPSYYNIIKTEPVKQVLLKLCFMSTWLGVRLQYSRTCELNVVYRHALCKSYKYFNGRYALPLCRLPTLILAPNILNIFEGLTVASSDVKNVHAVSSKINKIYIL